MGFRLSPRWMTLDDWCEENNNHLRLKRQRLVKTVFMEIIFNMR